MHFRKSQSYILDAYTRAMRWIHANTIDGGITHSSIVQKPYPEVTGYYIPTLMRWGERDLARTYGDWLCSIQTKEGAWQDTSLSTIYTFDTGQILKGMYALADCDKKYEQSLIRGCDWLLSQIEPSGRIQTPTTAAFANEGSEYIHLYAIEALKLTGIKYKRVEYTKASSRALSYYLKHQDLLDFKILSHFHAYIIEALIDLGAVGKAQDGLKIIEKYQGKNGAIPGYPNVSWVCLTALMQYAVCYYKLGDLEKGNKLLDYAISKQNASGGFHGGSGWFVTYFKKQEISWPVKYLLDAIHYKLALEFANTERAESFHSKINQDDGRFLALQQAVTKKLSEQSSCSILDVGTGKGRFIAPLLDTETNIDVVAMDISDKLFQYLPVNCRKIVGNICQIPLQEETFDVVFCCEVLEHAVNIRSAIKELARVLNKRGKLIIIDKDKSRQGKTRLETWEQWFDPDALVAELNSAGLKATTDVLSTTDGPPIRIWTGCK